MTNPVRCKTEQGKRVACPASNEMIPGNSRSMVRPAPVYRKINGCHLAGLWLVRIQNPAYDGAFLFSRLFSDIYFFSKSFLLNSYFNSTDLLSV